MTEPPALWKHSLATEIRRTLTEAVLSADEPELVIEALAEVLEQTVRERLARMIDSHVGDMTGAPVLRHERYIRTPQVLHDVVRWLRGDLVLAAVGHIRPEAATTAEIARDLHGLAQLNDDTGPKVLAEVWARQAVTP